MFGYAETWEAGKRYLLGDIKFLEKLVNYDVSIIKDGIFEKLRVDYL